METWAIFSIIDNLKPIGDQTQEELDQLEAVDYLRVAQVGEPSFCPEFNLCDAPETRMNRGGDFLNIYKRIHFVDSESTRARPHNRCTEGKVDSCSERFEAMRITRPSEPHSVRMGPHYCLLAVSSG